MSTETYDEMCERIFAEAREEIRREATRGLHGKAHSYVDVGDYKTADPDVLAARVARKASPGERPRPRAATPVRPRGTRSMHAKRKSRPWSGRTPDDIDHAMVRRPLPGQNVAPYHRVGRVPGVSF